MRDAQVYVGLNNNGRLKTRLMSSYPLWKDWFYLPIAFLPEVTKKPHETWLEPIIWADIKDLMGLTTPEPVQ
jgi:hypothetical protein